LVAVDGEPVADRVELAQAIRRAGAGTSVTMAVKRGESVEQLQLTVPEPDLYVS
jgi:S1-C subfamily serine protease